VLGRETLLGIIEVARQHNLWIISDEAYEDIIFAPNIHYSTASLAGDYAPRVISVFSFSKSHALAGLRVGYVVTRSSLLRARLPKILRCSTNGVNSLAQWGALAAVTGNQDHIGANCAAYLERRDIMLEALRGIPGVRPFAPAGTFFIWADLDPILYERLEVPDADALSARLASDGIGSVPGDAFGSTCEDAIRLSFSCDTRMVREGSALLRGALS
jgi:aspartate aminotransferase